MSLAIRKMPLGLRLPSARLAWIVTALLLLLGTATAAYGFWASITSSNAAATADILAPGSKPDVTANGTAVSVTWAGGTTVNGHAATGYTVTRYSADTGGTGTAATDGCAGTVATLTCTEQNVPGGTWYYTVTPTISLWSGAESPRSTGISTDSVAPVATVQSVSPTPNAAGWNNTGPVTVTITADDGAAGSGVASITYAVDGDAMQTVSGAVATVTVSGDGTHTLSYFATDKAGNAGIAQTHTVNIDSAAPATPDFTTVPAYVFSGNVANVQIKGTSEAGAQITLAASDAGAAHSVTVTPKPIATPAGTWSASLDLTSLNQGTVTYTATATDAASNTSTARTTTNTKDTVAPSPAQALNIPPYIAKGKDSAVLVSGTAEALGIVTVTATDSGGKTAFNTATAVSSGDWSLNLNCSSLVDGTITYTVTVTDAAGNTSTPVTPSPASMKDTVTPVLTISAPMYVNSSTANTGVEVSGTAETGAAVSVTVRDSTLKSVTTTFTATGTSWNIIMNLSQLSDGTLTYTAASSDPAGNSTTATANGTTSKDTAAPTVKGIVLTNPTGSTPGKADAGDTLTIEYSEALDAIKLCSKWDNSGLQTLAGNNDVTVTFNHSTNGGTSNTMTVSSKTCTLNLGTISLGANANYAATTAPVVFVGANTGQTSTGASTVTWNPGAKSLIIRLGDTKNNTGTQGSSVPLDGPTYAPATGLADLAGNSLGTAGFTAPASGF
ncbi:hypothetical protein QFZ36_001537 [Pseudarthrobacter siccitolerans]|uniref:Bacterial Ig-like domain-containing protein n=1 Tax=Pseudarthrobacter siccitolerans TaxID=861266 RepID=A0ABU0PJ43_9MICC|nr:Ig-like domain-containing protein [Pseudarthrobacter siccitolerans]MDQ0673976.1 hypothetical protein [Pseudarthrobacter siccitolerans]